MHKLTRYRPPPSASTLLLLFDFSLANKLFRLELVTKSAASSTVCIASFISLSSYMFQHARRSQRASLYASLNLLTLHVLLSDLDVARRICSPDNAAAVRLCRQKAPMLPPSKGDRIMASALIDAVTIGISHNLRQRLDPDLYSYVGHYRRNRIGTHRNCSLLLSVLLRLFAFMSITRTKLGKFQPRSTPAHHPLTRSTQPTTTPPSTPVSSPSSASSPTMPQTSRLSPQSQT